MVNPACDDGFDRVTRAHDTPAGTGRRYSPLLTLRLRALGTLLRCPGASADVDVLLAQTQLKSIAVPLPSQVTVTVAFGRHFQR